MEQNKAPFQDMTSNNRLVRFGTDLKKYVLFKIHIISNYIHTHVELISASRNKSKFNGRVMEKKKELS